jgi:hypothetical protein
MLTVAYMLKSLHLHVQVLMLTLQNDPPTLDSGAEDKEQYKAYGRILKLSIFYCTLVNYLQGSGSSIFSNCGSGFRIRIQIQGLMT